MTIPEPVVLAGRDIPRRPRCFRCAAVRIDYSTTGAADKVRPHVTVLDADPLCTHRWTDE